VPTNIPWTDEVWNPVTGCSSAGTGCDHCYARRMANRLRGRCGYPKNRPFSVTLHPDKLSLPFKWKKPKRIFVDSMGDLFHVDVPERYIAAVFGVMALTPQHTYIILTKRPRKAANWFSWLDGEAEDFVKENQPNTCTEHLVRIREDLRRSALVTSWPLKNVWILISAENNESLYMRLPHLFRIPAAVRGISLEPLLEWIDLETHLDDLRKRCNALAAVYGSLYGDLKPQWVILGCESGPGRRSFKYDWAREIRDCCVERDIRFYFKQAPDPRQPRKLIEMPELDEITWNQFPKT